MANVLSKLRRESGFSVPQVAAYLGIGEGEYLRYENETEALTFDHLECLADLYHVEEYDILTGTAESQTVTPSPKEEAELIPFFKTVQAYMKMTRLLEETVNGQRP